MRPSSERDRLRTHCFVAVRLRCLTDRVVFARVEPRSEIYTMSFANCQRTRSISMLMSIVVDRDDARGGKARLI
jgi:hypothetical protein